MKPGIDVVVRLGQYGERVQTFALDLSPDLLRELTEPMELSDDPLSVLLASPGLFGGKGDAVTLRKRTFSLRRAAAAEISEAITKALFGAFGERDEVNGYRRSDWSERDHQQADFAYKAGKR